MRGAQRAGLVMALCLLPLSGCTVLTALTDRWASTDRPLAGVSARVPPAQHAPVRAALVARLVADVPPETAGPVHVAVGEDGPFAEALDATLRAKGYAVGHGGRTLSYAVDTLGEAPDRLVMTWGLGPERWTRAYRITASDTLQPLGGWARQTGPP